MSLQLLSVIYDAATPDPSSLASFYPSSFPSFHPHLNPAAQQYSFPSSLGCTSGGINGRWTVGSPLSTLLGGAGRVYSAPGMDFALAGS